MTLWCRLTAEGGHGSPTRGSLVIEGPGLPDLDAVDDVARWILEAKRAGRRLVIEYLAPEMADLLDLVGLGVEVQGKTEEREEPHGIQRLEEERHLGDLPS